MQVGEPQSCLLGGPRAAGDPSMNTWPARRRPAAHEEQEGPGAERLSERDRERSGLASDGAGAGGRSLGRRRAEGVLQRPEERTPKKRASKVAGGVSGPSPQDDRTRSMGRENTGSDPLDT
ncbi:hypothetical protein NDU88_005356 [Pleurodeles waltl]|uniref:Uncharacterized protein n=1 Tax=Pleurodeles waltl TaxID=8319 RepID=A0AAV7PND8_PLEWA|nr:hypothetical protein NDU88_005356 [Pleurodeles waltl]